jgi:hypothetical protein
MTIVGFHVSAGDLRYLGHDLSNNQNDIDALDDKKADPSANKN